MTVEEFADGWKHFCKRINFGQSSLDAKAIRFMNEMPAAVAKGLSPDGAGETAEKATTEIPSEE